MLVTKALQSAFKWKDLTSGWRGITVGASVFRDLIAGIKNIYINKIYWLRYIQETNVWTFKHLWNIYRENTKAVKIANQSSLIKLPIHCSKKVSEMPFNKFMGRYL